VRDDEPRSQTDLFASQGPLVPGKTEYEDETFSGVDFSALDLSEHCFEACAFSSCRFREMALPGTIFRSCSFKGCELVLVKLNHVILNSVSFESCKVMGLNFSECESFGFSPEFRDCILDSAVFFENNFKRGKILKCRLASCDLIECDFREADFSGSSFENVTIQKCDFAKADFRTARGYAIDPLSNKVRKARFRLPEAQSFLGFLGISIED
jgi:uncharacterized protein YjbI with pentapeptide repeats